MRKVEVYYGRFWCSEGGGKTLWTLSMRPQTEIEALEGGSGRVELIPETELEVDESELDSNNRYYGPVPDEFAGVFVWCGLPNEDRVESDVDISGKPIPRRGQYIKRGGLQGVVRKVELFGDQKAISIVVDCSAEE